LARGRKRSTPNKRREEREWEAQKGQGGRGGNRGPDVEGKKRRGGEGSENEDIEGGSLLSRREQTDPSKPTRKRR